MEHIIKPEDWKQIEPNPDGTPDEDTKYYVYIPFECDPEADTVMQFIDGNDYIQEHKEDFDLLNNGESNGSECWISADARPACVMKIEIKTVDDAGGRVVYDKKGNPEYLPPKDDDFSMFSGMMGGFGMAMPSMGEMIDKSGNTIGMKPRDIVDVETTIIDEVDAEKEGG